MFLPGDGRMEVLGADPSPGTRRSFRGQVMFRNNWNTDSNESKDEQSMCLLAQKCRYKKM